MSDQKSKTQAIAHGLTETIRKSSEQNRATLAEYINMTVDKKNRSRDYTAEDIANDTDGITHWLAVMQFAGNDFINYDAALMDESDENAINEKIAQEQAGAESVINDADSVIENAESVVEGEQSVGETKYSLNKDAKTELHKALYDRNYQNEVLLRDETPAIMLEQKGVKNLPMTMNASHIRENVFSEKEAKSLGLRIDDHTHYHELGEDFFLKIIDGLDNVTEAYRGTKNATDASRRENYFLLISTFKDKNGNTINVPVYIDEHALYNRVFIDTNKISTVFGRDNLREYINKQVRDKNLVRIKRSTQPSESRALIARHYGENASKDSIHQNEPKVNPDDKKISDKPDLAEKPAKTAQESANKSDKADEAKTKEKSTGAKDEGKAAKKTETPSPSPDGVTSPEGRGLKGESNEKTSPEGRGEADADENTGKAERSEKTDVREKARKRAEKLLKWNEEQRPTVKELNDAREYVKGFDSLEINRRLAIIRMIRSAEGKVDKKILKGVANIMAAVPKADIEIRFADGIGGDKGGLYTHIGNKTLLVIDRGTDFKNTIQGTIAHELVHYLENRAGYKAFAEYVMKRVKPEMKAKVTKQYTEYYRGLFTAQFMKGEGDVEGKYDLDESFGKQLQDWKQGNGQANGLYNGKYFRLGTTPNVLIKHGAPAGEVIMFEDCLLKITGLKHSISLDELSKIPSQLNDPILLFKGSVENSFVALTEIKDKSGNDVIVAVHINKKLGRSVINKITSVYSKTDDYGNNKINNYVTEQIKKGNLLDASAKKAPNWFTTSGLQLPHVVQTILDANNSISQKHDIVNPTEQKNQKNNLSGEENIPEEIKARVEAKLASREFQELIESEIVAKYIGKALNNEKLLKKYADKDKKFITRVGGWLARTVTSLKKNKDVDKETIKIADEMAFKVMVLLQSESVGESSGTKYDAKELYVQDFNEEEIERYYKTGKTSHAIHKKNDIKNLTGSAVLIGDSEIGAFIREAVKESKNINKGYGVVPKALSDKIASSTDNYVLTENWFLELSSDDLFHLYREHHKAKDVGDLDMEIEELVSLPKKIDGTADFLGVERVKTQTKIKLGVKTESGGHYIVVELVSKDSKALRLKNAWKVSKEKYYTIKKEEPANTHNRTNNSPAISDDTSSSTNSISQKSDLSTLSEKKFDLADDIDKEKKKSDKVSEVLNDQGEVDKIDIEKRIKEVEEKKEKLEKKEKELRAKEREIREKELENSAVKTYTSQEIYEKVLRRVDHIPFEDVLKILSGDAKAEIPKKDKKRFVKNIYYLLHEASEQGEAGRGSVMVKGIAVKVADEYIEKMRITKNGKTYKMSELFDAETLNTHKQELADVFWNAFCEIGRETEYGRLVARLRKLEVEYREKYIEHENFAKYSKMAKKHAKVLKNLVEREKRSVVDEGIVTIAKALSASVSDDGNIRIGKVDAAADQAADFYNEHNKVIFDEKSNGEANTDSLTDFASEYNPELRAMIDEFTELRKERKGKPLTADEVRLWAHILGGLKSVIRAYDRVYKNGKWVALSEQARICAEDISSFYREEKEYSNKVIAWLGKKCKGFERLYFYSVISPENVIEAIEGYSRNGILKSFYHQVREATQRAEKMRAELLIPFAQFLDAKGEIEVEVGGEYGAQPKKTKTIVTGKKITPDMSDAERYEVLKDRTLSLSARFDKDKLVDVQENLGISDDDIEFSKYGDRKKLFKKLGDEFSVYHQYSNADIQLDFSFSKGNMGESVSKQGKNFLYMAKMLTCLDEVVENAIGIEIHNRNNDGYKTDSTLENVYVLASTFVDGDSIIPVKLEIKKFSDKENTLYVAIALESIKTDGIVKQEVAKNGVARQYSPPSNISIAQFFSKINTLDESFLKYVPDGFLSEEQLETKKRALDKDAEKYGYKKEATSSFTNGANRQSGEESKKTSEKKKMVIDPRWEDENGKRRTYRQKLVEKKINLFGQEMSLGEAIYLYMLTKRKHAEELISI